jgi:hypothetical protein
MKDGDCIDVAHSEEERDKKVAQYEKLLKSKRLPGRIVTEHRRVKFTHQWDIYYYKD